MLWTVVGILAALVIVGVGVVVMVGRALPVEHEATCAVRLNQPDQAVWDVITGISELPTWRPGLKRVELLPSDEGTVRWREFDRNGNIGYEITDADPPKRLVTRITDTGLPFGGTWTWTLEPQADGVTSVSVTENGQVYNILFRLISRFVIGHTATMRKNLTALAAHFGESATIGGV
jgi:uncharacterized protein YndB with AHSA1/START domain